ncbi:MAG TPA: dihydroorotase [Clostridiales bacterium]|nr:dihydroorotase [Clostridiales bacterium]
MLILIKNGYVIDPASRREGIFDILVQGDRISKVDKEIDAEKAMAPAGEQELKVIDARGKYIMPGFIDLHVHLREPGFEYKETIATGALAAAAGGYTSICPMPNTKPVTDSPEVVELVLDRARRQAAVNILPVGAITLGQEGKELADLSALKDAGAVALSEDGKSVMDSALYAEAMRQAAKLGIPIFAHCEDKSLAGKGAINAGGKAQELGLPGISNAVEDIITARDILLAKDTGAQLHICHISTRDSARMVGLAKQERLRVTGEVCPHHFILSDEDIQRDDADYKMNPPLRSRADIQALKEALRDGIVDVISTDHAPHSEEEKRKSCKEAPFGIVGSETAFALTWTELVKTGYLTPGQMVEKMSVNPAKILGIDRGCIGEGWVADLTIVDPEAEYVIDKRKFLSKGKNTPFHGRKVTGRVEYTFVAGKLVYQNQLN